MFNVVITKIELHCFSDASKKAYATVAYLRILFNDERIRIVFVASKTRVSPLKKLTLPRLELMGALLSARLSYRIIKALNFNLVCRFWTDSQITLFWIKGTANKFKPFIKNRIEEIVKLTSPEDWYFCPGKSNSSDLASRGTSVFELRDNPVWFQGPEWLELTSEYWSMQNNAILEGLDGIELEYRKTITWKFIVERGAWWGGFYERLVKSVMECLRKVLGRALLSFEELSTILTEVEAVLNSRPLTYVYNDLREPLPLQPVQFLNFARWDSTLPINFREIIAAGSSRLSLIKRKKYQDLLVKQLWSKWKKQYIMDLRNAHALKNPNPQRNMAIDDVVLIEGDNKSKLLWKLGRVIQVFPGRDGGVRSCLLKTSDGPLKRPVKLLYPLEL
ncbi:hypothetical protein AVEN_94768-1 [Araneus ventricosus]|uniref:DUF5641 domain-containing protein n=1 Tax=Araneus ventricosus TaxID=182803 RepID=A0A4Y2CMS9_ARAVE|nr:hypothetical protein AVEN_94768-1 [Araneus ventricosus]